MKRVGLITLLLIVMMVASACNVFEEAAGMSEDAPIEEDAHDAMEDSTEMMEESSEMMEESAEMVEEAAEAVAYTAPAFANLELVNAQTGETFRLSDFAGKTVYVHAMATWCGNCRASQRSLRDNVVPNVSGDDVVFVSLSVETNIEPADLAVYAQNESFGWTFAVMSNEMLAALSQQFGRTVTVPPSQPHFIIRPDGSVTDLLTGNPAPQAVIESLQS